MKPSPEAGHDACATPLAAAPELRLVGALLVAGAALGFAVLFGLARAGALSILDLSRLRPSTTVRGLEGAALAAHFDRVQVPVPERRPFELTLQLPRGARPGDVLTAEGAVARRGRPLCFSVLATPAPASAPDAAPRLPASGRVWVGGELRASFPLTPSGEGRLVQVDGVEPRRGRVRLRFEIRAERPAPGAVVAPAAVHFELARLGRCP